MKECPLCFHEIFDDQSEVCPLCGSDLGKIKPVPTPARNAAPDDAFKEFQKQFETKGIQLTKALKTGYRKLLKSSKSEMKRVTVLMVKVPLFANYDFFKLAIDCIHRRSGFVSEISENAVFALFGAPVAFDHDTESALRAALDIRECFLQELCEEDETDFRIGIATGPVQVEPDEESQGKSFHVTGATKNLAEQLMNNADSGEILICSDTEEITRRAFKLEETPSLSLNEISDNYTAYRLLGQKDREAPLHIFETAFCGRQKEIASLKSHLNEKNGFYGKAVFIEGEAGIGKSRLLEEVLKDLETKPSWWKASPFTSTIMLHPVIQWLRDEIGIGVNDSAKSISRAIHNYLCEESDNDESDPLLLEYLFGIPEAIMGMPPERVQKNLFALLRKILFRRQKGDGRFILVADDVQWYDALTVKFIQTLSEWPDSSDQILIFLSRPGSDPIIKREKAHLHIRLEPMDRQERACLLRELTLPKEFLPEIREVITSRATGNPLFLEEMTQLVRAVSMENNHLNGEVLKNRIIEVIPVSLQDLIQSRIDRLETRLRHVLQCASVLGLDFMFSIIGMFEIIRENLEDNLHALKALRYIEEQPQPSDISYCFTHEMFRDAAYSTLLKEQKQRLHANIARRLEEVFSDRIPEYAELLAYHYCRAKRPHKAIYYLVKAADRQAGLGGNSNALENYDTAIDLLETMPSSHGRIILMARLLIYSARLQRKMGYIEEAKERLEAALDCAGKLNNERLALEANLEKAAIMVFNGEKEDAAKILDEIIRESVRLNSKNPEMVALLSLGVIKWREGEFDSALKQFQTLAKIAERETVLHVEADAFNNSGLIYWKWGELSQAQRALKRALPLRRKISDKFGLCATLMNLGIIQEQMGKVGSALESYRASLKMAKETGYAQAMAAIQSNLSNLQRRVGNAVSALEHALSAIEYAKMAGDPKIEADALENAGLAHLDLDQFENAEQNLVSGMKLAKEHSQEERLISIRISMLELKIAQGRKSPDMLDQINSVLTSLQDKNYPENLSRAYRIKAELLNALDRKNQHTVHDYLKMAHEIAKNTKNIFEEIKTLNFLITWGEQSGEKLEIVNWKNELDGLQRIINN